MDLIEVDPLIRDSEVAEILGCSKTTVWRRVKDGTLRKPIKLGGMSRWPISDILEIIDSAKDCRD